MKNRKLIIATVAVVLLVLSGLAVSTTEGVFAKIPLMIRQATISPSAKVFHLNAEKELLSSCKACHGDMKTNKTPWHKKHFSAPLTSFKCSTCHKVVKQGERTTKGKVLIDRTVCLKCHKQKFSAYTEQHEKASWINDHKKTKKETKQKCLICHNYKELNFCSKCHDAHPHNKKWVYGGHGKKAVKTNFECLKCHKKETWCTTQCHEGVTLPHNIPKWSEHYKDQPKTPKWPKYHFRVAMKQGVNACRRCHKFKIAGAEFCQKCHHRKFYKEMPSLGSPWATLKGGMAYVKAKGAYKCWQCHDPAFCSYCHTTGKKPPMVNYKKKIKGSQGLK